MAESSNISPQRPHPRGAGRRENAEKAKVKETEKVTEKKVKSRLGFPFSALLLIGVLVETSALSASSAVNA